MTNKFSCIVILGLATDVGAPVCAGILPYTGDDELDKNAVLEFSKNLPGVPLMAERWVDGEFNSDSAIVDGRLMSDVNAELAHDHIVNGLGVTSPGLEKVKENVRNSGLVTDGKIDGKISLIDASKAMGLELPPDVIKALEGHCLDPQFDTK